MVAAACGRCQRPEAHALLFFSRNLGAFFSVNQSYRRPRTGLSAETAAKCLEYVWGAQNRNSEHRTARQTPFEGVLLVSKARHLLSEATG